MRSVFAAALLLQLATVAFADSFWDHNDSIVRLEASGDNRKFFYHAPAQGLPAKPRTLLFNGMKNGNLYEGMAYVFSSRCGPVGYEVRGPISVDQLSVTVEGRAPKRDSQCKVTGYRNDVLTFRYRGSPKKLTLKIGKNAFGFHILVPYRDRAIDVEEDDEHLNFSIDHALMEVGKKPEIYLYRLAEHENIENAWASLAWTPYGPQTRLIVYNSQWFQRSAGENRSYYGGWVAWVFYHETGHHICGHVPGDGSKPWKELEADQAAGAFLAREKNHPYQLGATLDEAIAAARARFPEIGGDTHPGREARIKAFLTGYNTGKSPCFERTALPEKPPGYGAN